MLRPALLLLTCLACTGCGQLALGLYFALDSGGSSSRGGGNSSTVVGPGGGTLTTAQATVTVPANALTQQVTLTVATGSEVALAGFMTLGSPVQLGPAGTTFARPVQVRMPFDPAALPAGTTSSDLVVLKRDDSTRQVIVLTPRIVGDSLIVDVTSFSTFQIAVQAGVDPDRSTLTATPAAVDADAATPSVVSILVSDASGRPLSGQAVALITTSSSITIEQPPRTGSDGKAEGRLISAVAQVVSITARVGSVDLNTSVLVSFLPPAPPPKPVLTGSVLSATQARLSWTATGNVDGFRLERGFSSNMTTLATFGADVSTYLDTTLLPLTPASYRLVSFNRYGSSYSDQLVLFPPDLPPSGPTNLAAIPTPSPNRIVLTWNDTSSNETWFLVERSLGGANAYTTVAQLSPNWVSWNDATALAGQPYDYRVVATNSGGRSNPSNQVAATIDGVAPVVSLLTPNTGDAIAGITTVTWTTVDANPSQVEVRLSADGGSTYPQVLYQGPDTGITTWDSSDAPDGNSYRIRVVATDAFGNVSTPSACGDFATSRVDYHLSWVQIDEPPIKRLAVRPDGDFYAAGQLKSGQGDGLFGEGEATETTLPLGAAGTVGDGFLARYGGAGELRWAQRIGTGAPSQITAGPVVTADGGALLAGDTSGSSSTLTLGKSGGTQFTLTHDQAFVARFDETGELAAALEIYAAPYGSITSASAGVDAVALYPDQSFVVVGGFSGRLYLGGGGFIDSASGNHTDVFVARYSSTGILQWASHAGPLVFAFDVVVLDDGTVVAGGSFGSAGTPWWFLEGTPQTLPVSPTDPGQVWVAAWTASGAPRWLQYHGGTTSEFFQNLTYSGGRAILGGYFSGGGNVSLVLANGTPQEVSVDVSGLVGPFQIAIRSDGGIDWVRYDASPGIRLYHLSASPHPDGANLMLGRGVSGVIGAGETNEASFLAATGSMGVIARYTSDGRFAWLHRIVGETVSPTHIAEGPNGTYIVTGVSQGVTTYAAGESGEQSAGSAGVTHYFLLKFEPE